MDNSANMLQLCRLCLVKDEVNIPIFEEQGDIRQIFLKISSCLPVQVSREDKLPKKICDGCSCKLDMLYEFWNTSANAEKQLLSWLGEAGMSAKMNDGHMSAVAQQIKPNETLVKEEELDPSDLQKEEDDEDDDDEEKSYMFQQKLEENNAGPSAPATSNEEEEQEQPPPKRARRTAAVKAAIAMDHDSDDDDDSGEPMTKVEDESEDSDGEDAEPAFVDAPSTSADDQPGPSGVGKDGADAPWTCSDCQKTFSSSEEFQLHFNDIQEATQYFCAAHEAYFRDMTEHTCIVPKRCVFCWKQIQNDLKLHPCFHKFNISELVTCHICGKILRGIYIDQHAKSHAIQNSKTSGSRPGGRCRKCNIIFDTNREYNQHRYKKHCKKNEKSDVVCYICGKLYSSNTIREHIKNIHSKRRNYKCIQCGKGFANKYKVDRHMIVHSSEYKHRCTLCNKTFKMLYSLRVHLKMHKDKLTFECIVCSKNFSTKQSRDNHLKKHTIRK